MARPTKCRRVCHLPETLEFLPTGDAGGAPIILTVDEFETIRLIDLEGLSQEACGVQLGVGRTTAQKIYDAARRKMAEALVIGVPLRIEGGDFRLCSGENGPCYRQRCFKRQGTASNEKGENAMRIAVTYENGEIFQHFGHTAQFKLYDVENGAVQKTEVVSTNGSGHGALAGLLSALQADVLICGGIGGGAQMALAQAGVKLYGGVSGDADEAVQALLAGKLDFNPNVRCTHHDHEHGGEAHACGQHGCGKEQCGGC